MLGKPEPENLIIKLGCLRLGYYGDTELRRLITDSAGRRGVSVVFLLVGEEPTSTRQVRGCHILYQRLLGYGNHLGLFSEMVDPTSGEALGNFPRR